MEGPFSGVRVVIREQQTETSVNQEGGNSWYAKLNFISYSANYVPVGQLKLEQLVTMLVK